MNLPEGWPTEAMIAEVEGLEYDFTPGGSETVTGCVSEEMAREIFEKMYAAVPTPPAQEDEPVAEVVKFGDGPWGEIFKTYVNLPSGTKLYLRPADAGFYGRLAAKKCQEFDKLRKVAEEFVDYFNPGADADRSPEQIVAFLQAYEKKLCAALEGK